MMLSKALAECGLVTLLFVTSCGGKASLPDARRAALPSGIVASVGDDLIAGETVGRIAAAGRISVRSALDAALFDALLSADAHHVKSPYVVHVAERRALSRRLLESFLVEARATPPTDEEVREESRARWWELDCPPLRRVTHAAVVVKKDTDDRAARAIADRLAVAVAGATDGASFRALANAVPKGGIDVRIEDLDPVAADGRAVNPAAPPPPGQEMRYSTAFSSAVFALTDTSRSSGVVRTEFGYHVFIVTELLPAHSVPFEERRKRLEPEIVTARSSKLEEAALSHARVEHHVDVERSALELTTKVDVNR